MGLLKSLFITLSEAIIVVSVLVTSTGAQAIPGDAALLERGTTDERHGALVRILEKPADNRDRATWDAIGREAIRISQIYRQAENDHQQLTEYYFDYYVDLIGALTQWRNPDAISPLAATVAAGGGVVGKALAKFGDLALPALLQVIRDEQRAPFTRGAAAMALGMVARGEATDAISPLSDAGRRLIVSTAGDLLETHLGWLIPVVGLALDTNDATLRRRVERLAADDGEWTRHGITDAEAIARSRGQVQALLRLTPQR